MSVVFCSLADGAYQSFMFAGRVDANEIELFARVNISFGARKIVQFEVGQILDPLASFHRFGLFNLIIKYLLLKIEFTYL